MKTLDISYTSIINNSRLLSCNFRYNCYNYGHTIETRNSSMLYNRNGKIDGTNIMIEQYTFCDSNRFTHIEESVKFEGYYLNNISLKHYVGIEPFQIK